MSVKCRKKLDVVEAFQMTKDRRLDNSEWPEWLNRAWQKGVTEDGAMFCSANGCLEGSQYMPLFIQTRDGTCKVDWDDYIIQDVQYAGGVLYLCKPDIFEAMYELVEESIEKVKEYKYDEDSLQGLLDFILGRGEWSHYGNGFRSYPTIGGSEQFKHNACVEMEKRGLIRLHKQEANLCIWKSIKC